jgi:hypothetical protein
MSTNGVAMGRGDPGRTRIQFDSWYIHYSLGIVHHVLDSFYVFKGPETPESARRPADQTPMPISQNFRVPLILS